MRQRLQGVGGAPVDELLIVDASIYLHRAYYAAKGAPLAVVRGFGEVLAEMLDTRPPTFAACAFDSGLKSFRADILPSYKAHRGPHPEGFDEQVPLAMRLASALGFAVLVRDRVEGDDLVGGAVRLATRAGVDATILSIDKDLAQLVQDEPSRVVMLTRPGGEVRDVAAVVSKYGVRPDQITNWIGIAGDACDGIPGVKGIGEGLAAKLLANHDTIEGVLAADGVQALYKTSPAKKAIAFARDYEQALLSRELAVLRCDDLLVDNLEQLRRTPVNTEQLLALCSEIGLDDWPKAIQARPASVARAILSARRGFNPSATARNTPETSTMANPTSVADRLAARRAKLQRVTPPPAPKRTAEEVLGEVLDIAPDDFDVDSLDFDDADALELVLAELKGESKPTAAPVLVDLDDKTAVIARIVALNPARKAASYAPLSLKILVGLLRSLEAKATGATGATGVNPPESTKEPEATEPLPKKPRGRKRTPPLPDEYGGKSVSRASVTELKAYTFTVVGLDGAKAKRDDLREIVEAHLRGEELPAHGLGLVNAPGEPDGGDTGGGAVVRIPGITDDDGAPVTLETASDEELADCVAHRSVGKGKRGDYLKLNRDDLEYLTLETLAAQAARLESESHRRIDNLNAPTTQRVSNLTKTSLAAAARAFASSLLGE